jgi:hypothetical protein
MGKPYMALVLEARNALFLDNKAFAQFVGVSLRTIERHGHAHGLGDPVNRDKLVTALYPVNPGLAREFAVAAGTSVEALGLGTPPVPPPPPAPTVIAPPPPPPIPEARPEHADSVLVAAANVNNVSPETVRPIVAAAFARASELGLAVAGLAEHLARGTPTAKLPAAPVKAKASS